MSKDIVECVHWDPETDPARQVQLASRMKSRWILLAGALAVLAVAVSLGLILSKGGDPPVESPVGGDEPTIAAGQTEPGTQPQEVRMEDIDPALLQGKTMYENGDHAGAIASLDVVLASNPESGEAYTLRGFSYFSQANYENAVTDLTKSLRYSAGPIEDSANIITMRGIAYYFLARYPEAIGDLTRALELNPGNTNAYTYRALCYDSTGRMDLAAADRARIGQ